MFAASIGNSHAMDNDAHATTFEGLPRITTDGHTGVKVAYMHVQYVKMLSLSSAGVQVEE